MASTVQGTVSNVSEKDFADRETGEPIKLYSFQLEGSNQWHRTGTTPVPANEGDNVKFVKNGQKVDLSTFEKVEGPVAPAPAASSGQAGTARTGNASAKGVSRDEYWANKEKRDKEKDERYQTVDIPRMTMSTAVASASTIIASAIEKDALSFGNAAKGKRLDMMCDFTEQVADRLYKKITSAPGDESLQGGEETSSFDEEE